MKRFLLLLLILPGMLYALNDVGGRGPVRRGSLDIANPRIENDVHSVGNVCMNVTNWGYFGNTGSVHGYGLSNPCPPGDWAPQMEYPCGSNVQYLFQGAVWFGAKVFEEDAWRYRVSVGTDGWLNPAVNELFPGEGEADGLNKRSNIPGATDCFGNSIFDPMARANEEFVGVYSDTLMDDFWINEDPPDSTHRPLSVEIMQSTMQWECEQLNEFIIAEFVIRNFGTTTWHDPYLGFYIDGDIGLAPPDAPMDQHIDDITGFLAVDTLSGDTVNIAWIADNDGRVNHNGPPIPPLTATACMGLCVLGSSRQPLTLSYNWWMPNGDWNLDVGPAWQDSVRHSGHSPVGDSSKYAMLSIGEQDWDQIYADSPDYISSHPQSYRDRCSGAVEEQPWRPFVNGRRGDIANGFDTRFLLGCGAFGARDTASGCHFFMDPGAVETLTVAFLIGPNFHNAAQPQPNPNSIDPALFDFTGLLRNARRAQMMFDSHYEFQPPAAPTLFAPAGSAFMSVPLIWNRARPGNVVRYDLFGIVSDTARVFITSNPADDTTAILAPFANGDTMRFGLLAVDDSGFTSAMIDTAVIVGAPFRVQGVSATAGGATITVSWNSPNDPEVTRYHIHRTSNTGQSDDYTSTGLTFVDEGLVSGRIYSYMIRAENVRGLLGFPSETVSAIPFAPQQRILVIDETFPVPSGEIELHGAYPDSLVDGLYDRSLTAMGHAYDVVHHNSEGPPALSLEQLSLYDLVIWHSEDTRSRANFARFETREQAFSDYVAAGGRLFREGRRLLTLKWYLSGQPRPNWPDFVQVPSDVDSFRSASRGDFGNIFEFTGADAARAGFPVFQFDPEKVESLRWNELRFNYFPEGDVLWPHDSANVLFRASTLQPDWSGLEHQPVALIDSSYIVLFFPLYLLHEEDATAILNNSIRWLRGQPLSVEEPGSAPLTVDARLLPNYPNPFNPATVIEYELRSTLPVRLSLFDVLGRNVATLVDAVQVAGKQRVVWDGSNAASGIYFVRLEAGNVVETRKIVMVK